LLLLLLPVLLFGCALFMLRVPLPASLEGARNPVAAIVTGLVGAACLAGIVVYVIASLRGAGRSLDPVLATLGLAAKPHALYGRQYHGLLQGRRVQVHYLPAQASRSARLDLYLDAAVGTRMAIGRRRPLLDCRDCPRLASPVGDAGLGADLGPLRVYAEDETQARRLLADETVRAAIRRLLADPASPGPQELYIQPGRVWLRARPWRIGEGQIEAWLNALLALAEAGENLKT
jgi:hypothetical protein